MGPLRRGLILTLLAPGAAQADVCADLRPGWDGSAVGPIQEALYLFVTPLSLFLILTSLLVLRFRHQWGALAVVVGWTVLVSIVAMADPTGLQEIARAEGCMGSPALFIGIVAAICGGMIIYTAPRSQRPDQPD